MQAIEQVLMTLIRSCMHYLTQYRGIGTISIASKTLERFPN